MAYDAALADELRELLADEPAVTEQRLFGGLAFLVGGHMAVAASGQGGILVRVDPGDTGRLAAAPGTAPMMMRGKPMAGWLRVDADVLRQRRELAEWVARGVAYARSLPPKSR